MTTCKNCSQTFEGNYCPQCGQKASTKRFSTRILFSELIDKIFPLDRGVLFTARHLLTRPGAMLRDYLDGKRAQFTKPIQFLLVMVAISLIFLSPDEFQQGFQSGFNDSSSQADKNEFSQKMGQWISANMTTLITGIIPFMALVAHWMFRKRGVNFAEHFVVTCYLNGGSTLVGMPFLLVAKIFGQNSYTPFMSSLYGLIYVAYCTWGYVGLFRTYRTGNTVIKGVLVVLLGYLFYILTAMVLGVIVALAYFSITGTSPK
jgi:hypothetical protein